MHDGHDASDLDVAAPLIHETNLCDERSPDLSVTPGTDLLEVTLDDPNAVCADGSPLPRVRAHRPAIARSPPTSAEPHVKRIVVFD